MPKSLKDIEKTKQRIIQAAYSLFSTQGYSATSIRQVATSAEIAQGGLYNHFADKEALFVAVISQYMPFVRIQNLTESAPDTNKREFLRYIMQGLIDEYRESPASLKLLLIELVEFEGKHNESIIMPVALSVMEFVQHLGSLDGEMRPIAPATLFRSMMGVAFAQFIGDALTVNTPIENTDPEEAINVFLDGVLLS